MRKEKDIGGNNYDEKKSHKEESVKSIESTTNGKQQTPTKKKKKPKLQIQTKNLKSSEKSKQQAIQTQHSGDGSITFKEKEINNITIGVNGLVYNGVRTSFIKNLNELEDLREILGNGSFSVVKKMRHKPTGKYFALKIMDLDPSLDDLLQKKLLELKTLHQSKHKYIVQFYGAFYDDYKLNLLLEWLEGGTFGDLIKNSGGIPENILGKLAAQLLLGLRYLHRELHIIHRDIKPSNILVSTKKGILKITDFGVSSELAHTQAMAKTFVGTVKYMSPNRIKGEEHSASSDIWSLGLSIAEAALGKYPYSTKNGDGNHTFFQHLEMIANNPAPTIPPDKFSPEFCSFIKECLNKEEDSRPDSDTLLEHDWIKKHENVDDSLVSGWIKKHVKISPTRSKRTSSRSKKHSHSHSNSPSRQKR